MSNAFLDTKCIRLPLTISGHEKTDEHLIKAALLVISFN